MCRHRVNAVSNLGGGSTALRGHFFLKETGHFIGIKRALLCLLQNLGGHVPPVPPVPTSMFASDSFRIAKRSIAALMTISEICPICPITRLITSSFELASGYAQSRSYTAELCKKLSRTSGVFFKVRHYWPLPMLICLYNSLFSYFLCYCIAAWGLTFESYLNPLFLLHKRVLRCIKFEPFTAPSAPIFQSLKILKLEDTLHLNILIFVYKAINRSSPSCSQNYF